ncbi:MAG: hypothetical protein JXX28_07980 [Deltaproteobacteria bacterium]|nr:hypothetical protein [Deltaproteobacteria bacterium]
MTPEHLVDWFEARVRVAAAKASPLHEQTLLYLITLLAGQVRADGDPWSNTAALADLYREAREAGPRTKGEIFRALGDRALLTLGWFPESLERRIVGASYYADMGALGYAEADRWLSGAYGPVFRELAGSFDVAVAVLDRARPRDPRELLLQAWLRGTLA